MAGAVDQELQHQARVVGRIAPLLLVGGVDRPQIEARLDQVGDEVRQIALRHPLLQYRSHQQHLVRVVGAKGLLLRGRPPGRRRGLDPLDLEQLPLHRCRRHANLPLVSREIFALAPDGSGAVTDPGS